MISIVMAYYNRKAQLIRTLDSIDKSLYKDIEVIIIDDCSSIEHMIEDIPKSYPFKIKITTLKRENKWYVNCCIPYNMGIAQAKGDIIIIQNPECYHIHDILMYVVTNLTDSNYLAMSTYALDAHVTDTLHEIKNPDILLKRLPQCMFTKRLGWYNHPIHKPTYLHFCAAITKSNLQKLGGFDERFAMGVAYDDNELVERVKRSGLKLEIPTEVSVFHQHHSKVDHFSIRNYRELHQRNKTLFHILTMKETSVFKKNSYATK